MNGDQDKPAVEPARQPDAGPAAVYNPPSLVEPAGPGSAEPVVRLSPAPAAPEQPAAASVPTTATASGGPAPAASAPAEQPAVKEPGGFYHAGGGAGQGQAAHPAESQGTSLSWVAGSESFQHHAGNWRVRMSLIGLGGALLVFVITRSYFSSIAILVAGLLFAFLGAKPPRPIEYRIDPQGLVIGRRRFSYGDFRSFWVSETMPTLNLVPLKRFAPVLVVRCDPKMVTEVVNAISAHLPMQAPQTDAVDGLIRKLKI